MPVGDLFLVVGCGVGAFCELVDSHFGWRFLVMILIMPGFGLRIFIIL